MTDKLDYWDQRLHNWALYYFGGSSLAGQSSLCILAACVPCWNDESRESALIGEAIDTANLVHKLDVLQQKALKAWYWSSGTKEFIASSLGIHRVTLWQRVRAAKERLGDLQFQTRRDMMKREVMGAIGLKPDTTSSVLKEM